MILNAAVDSAIAISERRIGKPGEQVFAGRPYVMIQRAFLAFKRSSWFVVLSGFVEPVLYLASFGFGLSKLVGPITSSGHSITYAAFIAPGLLATSAMNGAIYDSTFNVFFKMHHGKVYNAMLATSLGPLDVAMGEIGWALLRGLTYAIGFMAVVAPFGLIPSAWGLLAIPAAVLIAFGFASVGMGITSYLKDFQQLEWVNFVMLPMFLFSGTLYSTDAFPRFIQIIIEALPLAQAIALVRDLTLGHVHLGTLWHILYFSVMIVGGLIFTTRRLRNLFQK
jgi:lipooligosaccharide transport system permease protein